MEHFNMKIGDMLKLRWLRMIAINDLQSDEHELVVEFTKRYQEGSTPSFTVPEVSALNKAYQRVRWNTSTGD